MYQHILVTLDESELAEQALPHAVALARAFGSTLHLVSVVAVTSPETLQIATVATDHEAQLDSVRAYMRGIRKRALEEGVETEWDVCQGDVAEEILRYREQQDCDLIVMSTHGRSGMGRWVYGSVADRILRHSPVPVLLVRAIESA